MSCRSFELYGGDDDRSASGSSPGAYAPLSGPRICDARADPPRCPRRRFYIATALHMTAMDDEAMTLIQRMGETHLMLDSSIAVGHTHFSSYRRRPRVAKIPRAPRPRGTAR